MQNNERSCGLCLEVGINEEEQSEKKLAIWNDKKKENIQRHLHSFLR